MELFVYPPQQPNRRICQRIGQGLRLGALDALVASAGFAKNGGAKEAGFEFAWGGDEGVEDFEGRDWVEDEGGEFWDGGKEV